MEGFYDRVEKGTTGEIIYQPVNIAVHHGRVFLQVSRDIYKMTPSMDTLVQSKIAERGLTEHVNWAKVRNLVKKKSGIAEDVTS